jgi:hypothetical protein
MPLLLDGNVDGDSQVHKFKRRKLQAHENARRGSRIFAPYRVRKLLRNIQFNRLTRGNALDNRARVSLESPLLIRSAWKNHIPDHHIYWEIVAYLRSSTGSEFDFSDSSLDSKRYNGHHIMEESSLCSLGWWRPWCWRCLGISTRKEGRRT